MLLGVFIKSINFTFIQMFVINCLHQESKHIFHTGIQECSHRRRVWNCILSLIFRELYTVQWSVFYCKQLVKGNTQMRFLSFNSKERVRCEWPMWSRFKTSGRTADIYFCSNQSLFSGNPSHSCCQRPMTYLLSPGFRSEKGMSSPETSPTRASLAAGSAANCF